MQNLNSFFFNITPSNLTVQSSEAEAITLSLKGFHLISKTGPLCPVTLLALKSNRPVWKFEKKLHNNFDENNKISKTHTINGYDHEGSTTSYFGNNCNELWVYSAKLRVVSIFRYIHIVIAFVPLCWFSVYVPEFGTSDTSEPKLKRKNLLYIRKIDLHYGEQFMNLGGYLLFVLFGRKFFRHSVFALYRHIFFLNFYFCFLENGEKLNMKKKRTCSKWIPQRTRSL